MNHVLRVCEQIIVMAIVISVILLFAGIGVLIVIHVCVVGRAVRRGFGNGGMVDRGSFGSASMSQDDIEKLPSFKFRDREIGSSPVGCAVCLENLKVGDKCRLLPQCKHSFHAACVDVWLLRTPLCPICRASADYTNSGLNFDEETVRYSESGLQYRENRVTESGNLTEPAVESAENQEPENGHPMHGDIEVSLNSTSVENTFQNQATRVDNQDERVIGMRRNQAEHHRDSVSIV